MYCPKCKQPTEVIDSRQVNGRNAIRRRRECLSPDCKHRFTTYEDFESSKIRLENDSLRKKLKRAQDLVNITRSALGNQNNQDG